MELLERIVALADAGRVVRLGYRRPGQANASEYLVEPYRLHRPAAGLVLHAWQIAPPPDGGHGGWRDFRLDRVTSADDAGESFEPRMPVTLGHDLGAADAAAAGAAPADGKPAPRPLARWSDQPIVAVGPADAYFRELESAMLDGQVTPDELDLSHELADRVPADERKAVHARVFANVLHEVVQDGRISHREELYLQQVRALLEKLGWAP